MSKRTKSLQFTMITMMILLISTLNLSLIIASAEMSNIYDDKHTIGFPNVSTNQTINISAEELRALLSSLKDLSNITSSCRDIECVRSSASNQINNVSTRLLKAEAIGGDEYQALKILSQENTSLQDLYDLIGNPELKKIINNLSASDLEKFKELFPQYYSRINELYMSGRISIKEYVAALELLRRIALERNSSDIANTLSTREAEVLRELIEGKYSNLLLEYVSRFMSGTASSSSQDRSMGSFSRDYSSSNKSSLIQIPTVAPFSISLPRIPLRDLITASVIIGALGIGALIFFFNKDHIYSLIDRLTKPRIFTRKDFENMPPPIRLYWIAVSILSRKVYREDSYTHREYLNKVYEKLGFLRSFTNLTKIYELSRFGAQSTPELDQEAVKNFDELRRDVKIKK
ncbi:MAG: hypothetical protein ACP5I7_04740 [Sulfolobales archaeon]